MITFNSAQMQAALDQVCRLEGVSQAGIHVGSPLNRWYYNVGPALLLHPALTGYSGIQSVPPSHTISSVDWAMLTDRRFSGSTYNISQRFKNVLQENSDINPRNISRLGFCELKKVLEATIDSLREKEATDAALSPKIIETIKPTQWNHYYRYA